MSDDLKQPPSKVEGFLTGLRLAASALISRARFAGQEGITYGGKRDFYEELGYPREITSEMHRGAYYRGGIAGRIVDAYPTATWRGRGELFDEDDPKVETSFEKEYKVLDRRLHFWPVCKRADILAGLGRYAVILIGAPGDVSQPVLSASADQISYIQPYAEDDATISSFDEDPASARFGLPLTYSIGRAATSTGASSMKRRSMSVHYTRVIHIVDTPLDDEVYGRPRLERVWNDLINLIKIVGGGSEADWRNGIPGIHFDLDKEMKLPEGDHKKEMQEQMDEFIHGLRRVIRTRGVTSSTFDVTINNWSPGAATVVSLISGATGIPQRLLLGSERGELSSTEDRNNWAERVQDRRDSLSGPFVAERLGQRLIELGALSRPKDDIFKVGWSDVFDVPIEQRIKNAEGYAAVNQKQGEVVVTVDEIRDWALGAEPLSEDQKTEIEAEKPDVDPNAEDPNSDQPVRVSA